MFVHDLSELHATGIESASFEEHAEKAIAVLRGQGPSGIVCGPITTGGNRHQIQNLEIFNATIDGLVVDGYPIFNQIPYEFGLRRLGRKWFEAGFTGYCTPILTVFYAKIFQSGYINCGWFIPGWESSQGARFEREKLLALKVPTLDLNITHICRYMLERHPIEHVETVLRGLIHKMPMPA